MPKKGAAHHFAKLDPDKVWQMRKRYAEGGISILDLANEFDVSFSTGREAITGRTWKSVPYPNSKSCDSCCGTGRVLV